MVPWGRREAGASVSWSLVTAPVPHPHSTETGSPDSAGSPGEGESLRVEGTKTITDTTRQLRPQKWGPGAAAASTERWRAKAPALSTQRGAWPRSSASLLPPPQATALISKHANAVWPLLPPNL